MEHARVQQSDDIRQTGLAHLRRTVQGALGRGSRSFNTDATAEASYIRLSMSYQPESSVHRHTSQRRRILRQHFTCESCGCRYSSLGTAFFCPACGHNSAKTTFAQAVETVRGRDLLP